MAALRYRPTFASRGFRVLAAVIVTIFLFGLVRDGRGEDKPLADLEVRQALDLFRPDNGGIPDGVADTRLRLYVLNLEADEIARQRELIAAMGPPEGFLDYFDDIVAWARSFESDNGFRAYLQSRFYALGAREGAQALVLKDTEETWKDIGEQDREMLRRLADKLGHIAREKKFALALHDEAVKRFATNNPTGRLTGCDFLADLALAGHPTAAAELARRFKTGDGLPRSDFQALYWMTIASFMGSEKEFEEDINAFLARTPSETQRFVAGWFAQSMFGRTGNIVLPCSVASIP